MSTQGVFILKRNGAEKGMRISRDAVTALEKRIKIIR